MAFSMDAFEAYRQFLAIKLHFKSEKYDYFRYRGSVKVTRDSFEVRNDKYHFHKLSKKPDLELFLACNIRDENDVWVGNLFEDKYAIRFKEAQKRMQSLEYLFKNDMSQFDTLDEALVVKDGEYPRVLNMFNRKQIMPETIIILDKTCKVFDYWDSAISDSIIWPKTKLKLLKYAGFMNFDINKFNQTLKDLY